MHDPFGVGGVFIAYAINCNWINLEVCVCLLVYVIISLQLNSFKVVMRVSVYNFVLN